MITGRAWDATRPPAWRGARGGRPGRRTPGRVALLAAASLFIVVLARGAEVIPPAPANHFNDYTGVVARDVGARLNEQLVQLERDTSSQILVAIYPRMQSESSLEDYTVRVYEAWKVGERTRDNGAVLFIFTADRRLRIATGYGLEGVLPDALCKRIIADEITPGLRAGDYNGAVTAGVGAMIAAAKGEYRGTGRTAREARNGDSRGGFAGGVIAFVLLLLATRAVWGRNRSILYTGRRRRGMWISPGRFGGWGGGGNWGGGGGGWSGGGGSFSGGGGSSGGGGASGSW